jgi:hypothetical protein
MGFSIIRPSKNWLGIKMPTDLFHGRNKILKCYCIKNIRAAVLLSHPVGDVYFSFSAADPAAGILDHSPSGSRQ